MKLVAAFLLATCVSSQAATVIPVLDSESALIDIPKSMQVVTSIEQSSLMFDGDTTTFVKMPQAKYNHPYSGEIRIMWHHPWNMDEPCRNSAKGEMACMIPELSNAKFCTIVLPAIDLDGNITVVKLEELFIHERAHCNGWDRNHTEN